MRSVAIFLGCYVVAAAAWTPEKALLDWFKNSDLVSKLHKEHIASESVKHMFKGTPLVSAPDDAKISFAEGPFGSILARFMASEQELIGDWKVKKIVEAAGANFNEQDARDMLKKELKHNAVSMFSFVDCPWCLLAKRLLSSDPYLLCNGDGTFRIFELEEMGRSGKVLRAAIALETGRTSMPAIFIGQKAIGGFTDGMPGLRNLHESDELLEMIDSAKASLMLNP